MNRERLMRAFTEAAGENAVRADEPMSAHTTFRIGGPADFFLEPSGAEEIRELLRICGEEGLPYFIMGNGSNLLVSDSGYRGAVIRIGSNMNRIEADGVRVKAESGAFLSAIASLCASKSLAGFEFAGGIPGSFGGACVMNAGAYGGELKQVLVSVTVIDEKREICVLPAGDLELGYRSSIFMKRPLIAVSGESELQPGDPAEIEAKSADFRSRRISKQPLDLPSAGSTFKRPEGYFAGKLIEDSGLKGYRVGGAAVSEKHCGFVVNTGGATAADVRKLIDDVKVRVHENFGVTLEPEIRMLGF